MLNDSLTPFLSLPPSAPSRQAWALVSVVGGGNASCSEDVREHENHDTGGRAVARRNFTTVDGVAFSVIAYSEWKNGERNSWMHMLQLLMWWFWYQHTSYLDSFWQLVKHIWTAAQFMEQKYYIFLWRSDFMYMIILVDIAPIWTLLFMAPDKYSVCDTHLFVQVFVSQYLSDCWARIFFFSTSEPKSFMTIQLEKLLINPRNLHNAENNDTSVSLMIKRSQNSCVFFLSFMSFYFLFSFFFNEMIFLP